jgi:hypothetical protein
MLAARTSTGQTKIEDLASSNYFRSTSKTLNFLPGTSIFYLFPIPFQFQELTMKFCVAAAFLLTVSVSAFAPALVARTHSDASTVS